MDDETFIVKNNENKNIIWSINQIKTTKELAKEGNRMRHCVLSYKNYCMNGSISIWSLSRQDEFNTIEPKVTIELSSSKLIMQARGLANRETRADEKRIIRLWAIKNDLDYA